MLGMRADWFVSEKVTKAHNTFSHGFAYFLEQTNASKLNNHFSFFFSMISSKISWINAGGISPAFLQDML